MTLLLIAVMLASQAPEGDPIRCWWRTSTGAVATGEAFDVVLTCSVREDGTVRVTLDETRLGAEAIQLAPFEVLSGTHPADLHRDGRRFFQYRYNLRVIDTDLIGRDAKLPDVPINYRIDDGRERVYLLQGQPVRVLSLVPAEAADIRDSSDENFARVEALRFRARAFQLTAITLGVLGIVIFVPALVRLARRPRTTQAAGAIRHLSDGAILRHLATYLAELQRESRQGWTQDLAHRAANAIRLVGACALQRPISQRVRDRGQSPSADRIVVPTGLTKRTLVGVSSPVTSADLAADKELQSSLTAFTNALYGATFEPGASLDEALEAALERARQLARERRWRR